MSENNPLTNPGELPEFSAMPIEEIESAIKALIKENQTQIDELCELQQLASWENFVAPMEMLANKLEMAWAPISHLNAVQNSEALRDVYNNCLALLTDYHTAMGQNRKLYEAYRAISEQETFKTYNQAQRKSIENELRDFRLSGIDLKDEPKQRLAEIRKRLAEITNSFSNHVMDATQGWIKQIEDIQLLAGLPEIALESAAHTAKAKDLTGYVITLDMPSYQPMMMYCDNEPLRKELYTAFTTRASDQGPNAGQWDNSPLMQEILQLRFEMAEILGFENYGHLSMVKKMARSPEQVLEFLEDMAQKSITIAKADFSELQKFANDDYGQESLNAWDITYYSEKLRQKKYAISQEELRPYFPVEKVINGMFDVVSRLYGIEFVQLKQGVDLYHNDVRFYHINKSDTSGNSKTIAKFYLDLYARENKRGGAWMADCRQRYRFNTGKLQLPVAFLTCNFLAPTESTPSLLTHNDVVTLFHEFGHGLHHMLTQVDVLTVAGISGVEWDAVELPSQFMENWCWQKEAISMISSHYETAEVLPDEMLDKLIAAKNFQAGMQMIRQLELSLFDLRIHMAKPDCDIQQILDEVRSQLAVFKTPDFNRFQHGFSHIFAGGYAAGYYSYKWAEVLSADAFSLFEEQGIFNRDTGLKFQQDIMAKGGSEEAMQLFINFRGREPSVDALLRHNGIY